MSRADYSYGISTIIFGDKAVEVLSIIDHNIGSMSVTNDAEAVLEEIAGELPRELRDFPTIYRDSDRHWDEIVIDDDNQFERFGSIPDDLGLRQVMCEAASRWSVRRRAGS